jgi:hypothetical protein
MDETTGEGTGSADMTPEEKHRDELLARDDGTALEGPDVETSTADAAQKGDGTAQGDGTAKAGGLGQDGTIPSDPDGLAAGHTGEQSSFEPEEDEAAPA